jgi:ABC-type cobalamin/Fe3+-siderophores transport system ATPase subunit
MAYKIIKLIANNFKNLKLVEIDPKGNVVTLAGPNGAGKSSVLDAVEEVIAGGKDSCEKPIRNGASNAETQIVLSGGLVAKRRYTPSGSTLRIEIEGEPQKSPQAIMDKLKNVLAFDPLSFTQKKPIEQREILLKLTGLDFSNNDAARQVAYDARTTVNRALSLVAAERSGAMHVSGWEQAPDEPVSVTALMQELEQAEAHNRQLDDKAHGVAGIGVALAAKEKEIENAMAQIESWKNVLAAAQSAAADLRQKGDAATKEMVAMERADVAGIKAKLANAESVNAAVTFKKRMQRLDGEIADKKATVAKCEAEMARLDAEKASAIREAKFPLEGLSFDDGGIFFNGIPFAQISTGQQLRVGVAICMALNPALKVIFIRDGSLLDQQGLAVLDELAKANDYQIWIEDTRSTDPAAVVLEDGEVVK